MARHPKATYVEMDSVQGCREQGKRMLTMLFVEQNLMLIFLMRDGKADTVVEQFDWLTAALGLDTFRKLFPVILTDNGSKFKHTREMEFTVDGQRRTMVYYCDPQASWQKPHVDKEPRIYSLCNSARQEFQSLYTGRHCSFAQSY